jgi:NitT/TauT family transport system permease protein
MGWIVLFAAIVTVWQVAAKTGIVDPIFSGVPSDIGRSFLSQLTGEVLKVDAVYTTVGSLIGFIVASALAIIIAFALSQSTYLFRVIEPFFTAMNSLPRVALAPLFLLWFGIGLTSKIVLAGSLAFFVVFSNTIAGIEGVDSDHITVARTMGATRAQVFRSVVIPSAVPSIFTGLELGYIYGMLGTVAGEMLAGEHGLGVRLQYFASAFATNDYFATLLLLIFITMTIAWILRRIRMRLLEWQSMQGSGQALP